VTVSRFGRTARIAELRDRAIARYDAKTGSNSAATHGPLIEAILEVLLEDAIGSTFDTGLDPPNPNV